MILNRDCLEYLREIESNSIDSVVTDPPYGISFMGKKWDYDVPKIEVWKEILRVLKPGGHALVACGTRTQHRMAVNLEDAGFEIRDIVAWVYGSGFPKSLNIGKAVDKLQGNERDVVGEQDNGCSNDNISPFSKEDGWNTNSLKNRFNITKGNSPHEGWGTALKPAMELWTLCRKPLEEKTVAQNVLKYGTGGINIDGCRVGTDKLRNEFSGNKETGMTAGDERTNIGKGLFSGKKEGHTEVTGRFPANLIHDGSDEVVGLFPYTKSGTLKPHKVYGEFSQYSSSSIEKSEGSASRFFYCAKASKSERNKELEGFEEKQKVFNGQSETPSKELKDVEERFTTQPTKNFHPTVKPISLMRYLCKLITPKGGIVLDPFAGSGSTGIGAKLEGFNFIGIEREEEYCKIAEARINSYDTPPSTI